MRTRRARRTAVSSIVAVTLVAGLAASAPPGASGSSRTDGCFRPSTPRHFHRRLVTAIRISRDLPRSWASSPYVAKIICWQGSGFRADFRRRGRAYYVWHGMFAMTKQEVQTIFGAWMTRRRDAFLLKPRCFVLGWDACPHRTAYSAGAQQIIAGLRWIWLLYGTPAAAWAHIKRTGRFDSYPRPGTDDTITRSPLRLCPVAGKVSYLDTFGQRRTVGGYHPHWGNDVAAPEGRKIRAPFDGFAVAHSDGWFAGHYVTVVGQRGYVRNGHLSRFGKLGWVKAGTVIGYVGETGDAHSTHDHFEWHPWSVPVPRHVSPYGFGLIMDAIDPFPFLNQVCDRRASSTRLPADPTDD